jgi:hypothetical protein
MQLTIEAYLKTARYEGPPDNWKDFDRLNGHIRRIFSLMSDSRWRTLAEIEMLTGIPQASGSAFLRHLRKIRFGGHTVNKRRRNDSAQWEYQLIARAN